MIHRIVLTTAFAIALGGCATYDSANHATYRDGNYRGNYDGAYYSAPADGYGDYYYDRPAVFDAYDAGYFGGSYAGFGFGSPWVFGFGYDPWFYRPWRGDGDGDGDADDWHHRWHRPWPHHHAASVGMDRPDAQRQMLATPIQPSGKGVAPPGMGHRAGGGRDHEERMRPRHQPH